MKINLWVGPPRLEDADTIDFTNYRTSLIEDEWEITQTRGAQIDSLSLTLDDQDNSISIIVGNDVVIDEVDSPNNRLFGGIITDVITVREGLGRIITLECQDYTALTDRSSIRKTYERSGQTGKSIIQDAFAEAALPTTTEIDTSSIQDDRVFDALRFQGASLRAVMEQISEISGYVWSINYFKSLRYHSKAFASLGFNFSDNPDEVDSFPYYDAVETERLADWNQVELQGGKDISNDITDIFVGDGSEKLFRTGIQSGHSPIERAPTTADDTNPLILVEENTNTQGSPVWTTRSVGRAGGDQILGVDVDVLWSTLGRTIEFNTAPPNFTNAFRVTGRLLIDIIVINEDTTAVARHGRRYKTSLIIPESNDLRQAQDLAIAYLRQHGDKRFVTFKTNKDGISHPDCICRVTRVTNTPFGLTSHLMIINRVTTRIVGGETFEYEVELESLGF